MIDFPGLPIIGQQFTSAGVTWEWDGVKWTIASAALSDTYMEKTIFDPQSIGGDAFDRPNHTGEQAISTITNLQTALDLKADDIDLTTHENDVANPHSVTQSQVGLGNVDNTSDANKPVSTAQQTALDLKEDGLGNPATEGSWLTSTVAGVRSWVARTFLNLTDVTDSDYTGKAGYIATVNIGETGMELASPTPLTTKAKCRYNGSGTLETGSVGVSATLRLSSGRTRVTWSVPYTTDLYVAHATIRDGSSANGHFVRIIVQTTTTIEILSQFGNPFTFATRDATMNVSAFEE